MYCLVAIVCFTIQGERLPMLQAAALQMPPVECCGLLLLHAQVASLSYA